MGNNPVQDSPEQQLDKAVWWVKRDFRISDNEALTAAATHQRLLVLFFIEPSVLDSADTSAFHIHAQLSAAHHLQQSLRKRGSELFFAIGEATVVFNSLHKSIGKFTLYAHQETGNNLTFKRDQQVQQWCRERQIEFKEKHQNGVLRGTHDREQRPATLASRLLESATLPAPQHLPPAPDIGHIELIAKDLPVLTHCDSNPVSVSQLNKATPAITTNRDDAGGTDSGNKMSSRPTHTQVQTLSESAAWQVLNSFTGTRGLYYSGGISSPNRAFECGSRLSAHLAWGTLSMRSVFAEIAGRQQELGDRKDREAARWRKSLTAFQSRLYWHDHFIQRFESATDMEFEAINPAYRSLQYPQRAENLQAWLNGTTGLPLVDACMRCLLATGFVNFRMRAMLVSVACYGLGLDWKSIQYPLARVFYDYEPGIHFSQVQMQAGVVGINTIRVYSPHKQLLEQDSDCVFTRRWVPELAPFSAEEIANYETRPLGDYPAPPKDFEATSRLMKDRIFSIRKSEEGEQHSRSVLAAHGSKRPSRRYPPRKRSAEKGGSQRSSENLAENSGDNGAGLPSQEQQQMKLDF